MRTNRVYLRLFGSEAAMGVVTRCTLAKLESPRRAENMAEKVKVKCKREISRGVVKKIHEKKKKGSCNGPEGEKILTAGINKNRRRD